MVQAPADRPRQIASHRARRSRAGSIPAIANAKNRLAALHKECREIQGVSCFRRPTSRPDGVSSATVSLVSAASAVVGIDCFGKRECGACDFKMKPFDHAAVDRDCAFGAVFRQFERGNDPVRRIISSADGANNSLEIEIWDGCMSVLPSNPKARPCRQLARKPSVSAMSLKTPSMMPSPKARAAATERPSAANRFSRRPVCVPRISLTRSFVPITRQASFPPVPAMAAISSMARGVSIIAQSAVADSASAVCGLRTSSGPETFGMRTASGWASTAAARSALPHCVESAFTRITISRLPKPPALTASQTCARACSFASGATASSRSRMIASTGRARAFSIARALEPGM